MWAVYQGGRPGLVQKDVSGLGTPAEDTVLPEGQRGALDAGSGVESEDREACPPWMRAGQGCDPFMGTPASCSR